MTEHLYCGHVSPMTPDRTAHAFRPLHFPDHAEALGAVSLPVADHLLRRGLLQDRHRLRLTDGEPTMRLEDIRQELFRQRWIEPQRHELMPVTLGPTGAQVACLDRSALRILGFWAQKVHVNGFVETCGAGGPSVWLSRRSHDAHSNPGRWDTLVAGGRAAGHSLAQTAQKEGWEEAGISPEQMTHLKPTGEMAVQYISARGFHQELLVIYDLLLPAFFQAACHDGEIIESRRLSFDQLITWLANAPRFKFSSYLVIKDFVSRTDVRPTRLTD